MSRHRFHGDPHRFEVIADYIADRYGRGVRYIADVAGGQGMLARILTKKHNYECEVIDPRGWVLKGVESHAHEFDPAAASYYDLIVGVHPDEALRAVAQAALVRPAILIPCCNSWSAEKLGREELLGAIGEYYRSHGVRFERVLFPFRGPKNIGLVSEPRAGGLGRQPSTTQRRSPDKPSGTGALRAPNRISGREAAVVQRRDRLRAAPRAFA